MDENAPEYIGTRPPTTSLCYDFDMINFQVEKSSYALAKYALYIPKVVLS